MVDREKGRPVRKLELHSQDGRLLGLGDVSLEAAAGRCRRRAACLGLNGLRVAATSRYLTGPPPRRPSE